MYVKYIFIVDKTTQGITVSSKLCMQPETIHPSETMNVFE